MNRHVLANVLFWSAFSAWVTHAAASSDVAEFVALPESPKGGVIVFLEEGNPDELIAARDAGRFVVQSVLFDKTGVDVARKALLERHVYGLVSVIRGENGQLPYTDDFANIVAIGNCTAVRKAGITEKEIERIVAPHGVVMVASHDAWGTSLASAMKATRTTEIGSRQVIVKPRPEDMDEWTHCRHDPGETRISQDRRIGFANCLQFLHGNIWTPQKYRSRTVDGKNYYYGAKGFISCRDAFNGMLLWRLRGYWNPKPAKKKITDPSQWLQAWRNEYYGSISFTAWEDRLYTFIEGTDCLVAIDGNTGKVVKLYDEVRNVGRRGLFHMGENMVFVNPAGVASVDRKTGKLNWRNDSLQGYARLLGSDDRIVYLADGTLKAAGNSAKMNPHIACLNLDDGKEIWRIQEGEEEGGLAQYGVLITQHSKDGMIKAYDLQDGRFLWEKKCNSRYSAFDGLIWLQGSGCGCDPKTGETVKTQKTRGGWMRCGEESGTVLMDFGGRPTAFVHRITGQKSLRMSVRYGCGSSPGFLLGNGLIYSFPKECRCFYMLRGITGFASHPPLPETPDSQRLLKGPAFGTVPKKKVENEYGVEWRTYLGNETRVAFTDEEPVGDFVGQVPSRLSIERIASLLKVWDARAEDQVPLKWTDYDWNLNVRVDAPVSAPTLSNGLVAVALPDSHRVVAFDEKTGEKRWTFIADARVVLPPTFYGGLAVFGGEDGYVYCLRAEDGELVWRFQAAPAQRRVAVFGQIESHWPVTGGVLVKDGHAYFSAFRHSHLNHGFVGYKVDAFTGELAWKTRLPDSTGPESCPSPDMPVCDKGQVQFANGAPLVDMETGKVSTERGTIFTLATRRGAIDHTSRRGDSFNAGRSLFRVTLGELEGDLFSHDGNMIFVGRCYDADARPLTPRLKIGTYRSNSVSAYDIRRGTFKVPHPRRQREAFSKLTEADHAIINPLWEAAIGTPIQGMVATKTQVIVTTKSGNIVILDRRTGKRISVTQTLFTPARWGLAVANGRVFLSTDQGDLVCY